MRIPFWAFGSLAVLILVLAQEAVDANAATDTDASTRLLEADDQPDACHALYDAQTIISELQPTAFAHLERKVGVLGTTSRGWTDSLGWGQDGPLSTAMRLFPRFFSSLLSPLSYFARIPVPSYFKRGESAPKRIKISRTRRAKIDQLYALLNEAEQAGCPEVHVVRAELKMFPPKGIKQDLPGAFAAYERYIEYNPDPEAQFMVGLFHSTGLGGVEEDQGKALLYYTFAALQGYRPAEMAMGHRHWAGIGLKENCMTALDYYEGAAEKAYAHFLSGPPGGRTLPLEISRLSDLAGGIYGPHASWASTGINAVRNSVQAASAAARGETEAEVLEYFRYHSDRDIHIYTVRLGKLYYLGSIYPVNNGIPRGRGPGISAGAEGVGEIPQSFTKAREHFLRVARTMWPKDFDQKGSVLGKRKMSKESEDALVTPAMIAAAFLGRMAMRGEGQRVNYKLARMWYARASELGDREAHNGLGIIHRDGLGTEVDLKKASHYFQAAAGEDLAEAQVHLGKMHMDRGELSQAFQYFEAAIRHGSPFEAFHLLAQIHATTSRLPAPAGQRGNCGVAVMYFKLVAERGSWTDDHTSQGDKAWARGEEDVAFVRWLVAAEMGSEVAQNNVAFLLDQDRGVDLFEGRESRDARKEGGRIGVKAKWLERERKALRYWMRSAAQNNVDAMVKVGDLFYSGLVNSTLAPHSTPLETAANYYQTAADTQSSAMAYWNLGWMYEMGKGVPRDWHLAKRYYDLSGDTAVEAWPAVMLSLVGLYARSWWVEIRTRGAVPGLRLFEPLPEGAEEETFPGFWDRLANLFTLPPEFDEQEAYDDLSGSQWSGGGTPAIDGEEWDEDLAETIIIGSVVMAIMGLVWLRGWYTRMTEERRRAEEERRRREGEVGGVGGVGGNDQAQQAQQAVAAGMGGWEGLRGGLDDQGQGALERRMGQWAGERREEEERLRREPGRE